MPEYGIVILMWEGLIEDVQGLPPGWDFQYLDLDTPEGQKYLKEHGKVADKNSILIIIKEGIVDEVINLPPNYDYEINILDEEKEGPGKWAQPKQILESKDKKATPEENPKNLITIKMREGALQDVEGLPSDWIYNLVDMDTEHGRMYEEQFDFTTDPKCVLIVVEGGEIGVVKNLPDGYDYDIVELEKFEEAELEEEELAEIAASIKKIAQEENMVVEDKGDWKNTFKIVWFAGSSGPGFSDYDDIDSEIFTGTYNEAVKHAKSSFSEELRDLLDFNVGYASGDEYSMDTGYFDPETDKKITEEEAKALDYEVTIKEEGFRILWDYPEKREDLENLLIEALGEENLRKPLKEWSAEEIIDEWEEYQRQLIEAKSFLPSKGE